MDLSVLNVIFWVCAIVGFAIPLLNVVLSWLGATFDFAIEADLEVEGLFPFNILCACLFLIVFGALGLALMRWMTSILLAVLLTGLCALLGACAYALFYRFVVRRLKDNDPSTLSYADILGAQGEVILRIRGESFGTISVRDSTGAALSFRAKIDPELRAYIGDAIPQGAQVVVTEVDTEEKFCYVSTPAESAVKYKK